MLLFKFFQVPCHFHLNSIYYTKFTLNLHPTWDTVLPPQCPAPTPSPLNHVAFRHNLCLYYGHLIAAVRVWGTTAQSSTHSKDKTYWLVDCNSSSQRHTNMNLNQHWEFAFKHTHKWHASSVRDTEKRGGLGIFKKRGCSYAILKEIKCTQNKLDLANLLLYLKEKRESICFSGKLPWAELRLRKPRFWGRGLIKAHSTEVSYTNGSPPICLLSGPGDVEKFVWKEANNSP